MINGNIGNADGKTQFSIVPHLWLEVLETKAAIRSGYTKHMTSYN